MTEENDATEAASLVSGDSTVFATYVFSEPSFVGK